MKKKSDKETMEKQLQWLLDELCSDLGFCLPHDDQQRLISVEYYDADQFTREVFLAEKMNPDEHLDLRRRVHKKVADRFRKLILQRHLGDNYLKS
ncbi:MAG: hypothetical protein GY749_48850 [Desulfobacteraceae bacterium]|nr:hypothetical protein [Desulfobacteraceae bacterium]